MPLLRRLLVAGVAAALVACGPEVDLHLNGEGDGDPMPMMPPEENGPSAVLEPNGTARVTADSLNLRDGIGTSAAILVAMPCGATVSVLEGPSPDPTPGWWRLTYTTPEGTAFTGWASGKYLVSAKDFVDSACGATNPGGGTLPTTTVNDVFARAKPAVGFSYWWGHGAWNTTGTGKGTCNGACPNCTHTGSYGADCSGFIAKVWQVPVASALNVDQHPYSTYNFYNEQTHWKQISRDALKPADALVRRVDGAGHIVLFEMGDDPFGSIWLYEARACSLGVVHNLRSVDSSYRAIRRDGL